MIALPPYAESYPAQPVKMAQFMLQPGNSTTPPRQWARELRTVLYLACGHTRVVGGDVREAKAWPCLQCGSRP